MCIYNFCLHCGRETTNNKFCSRSCSATYNNKGVRRNGNAPTYSSCKNCGVETKNNNFCSRKCFGIHNGKRRRQWNTETERKKIQAYYFMTYYTKKKNQTPDDADLEKIKEFYKNCPEGYEVDHIVPISKGGLHHQNNLQYLTMSENRSKSDKLNWHPREESNLMPSTQL